MNSVAHLNEPSKGKFMRGIDRVKSTLSTRQNIVVIADEAHRSQYGFGGKVNEKTGKMSYGFASNLCDALPNSSYIGFTGTPIEKTDANMRAVFGHYISIYDIQRAVADKSTVPCFAALFSGKLRFLNMRSKKGTRPQLVEVLFGADRRKYAFASNLRDAPSNYL